MISLGNRNAKHAVTDEELSAFADGQLPPHRARTYTRAAPSRGCAGGDHTVTR